MEETEKSTFSETKKKRKNNRINLRVDDDAMDELNRLGFEDEKNISDVVRTAINTYIRLRRNNLF